MQVLDKTALKNAPIGLFDSGVGGLSVFQHLHQRLPDENYLYFADTLNVPYGGRVHSQIVDLTVNAVDWLCQQGCKIIVIACNSASAHALDIARQRYPQTPIVGLVPALKPAVIASQSKHVAVLATQATLNGALLQAVIEQIAQPQQTKVTKHFEPMLVPWVEAGMPSDCITADKLKATLDEFHADGVDQLVLGCTHYPFFRPFVEDYIQQNQWQMQVVDSGQAIANRVYQLLAENGLLLTAPALNEYNLGNDHTHNQSIVQTTVTKTVIKTIASPSKCSTQQLSVTNSQLRFYASKYDHQLAKILNRLLPHSVELLT